MSLKEKERRNQPCRQEQFPQRMCTCSCKCCCEYHVKLVSQMFCTWHKITKHGQQMQKHLCFQCCGHSWGRNVTTHTGSKICTKHEYRNQPSLRSSFLLFALVLSKSTGFFFKVALSGQEIAEYRTNCFHDNYPVWGQSRTKLEEQFGFHYQIST